MSFTLVLQTYRLNVKEVDVKHGLMNQLILLTFTECHFVLSTILSVVLSLMYLLEELAK